MWHKKFTLLATVLSFSLCGSALATPERCAQMLQQSDGYDPYICDSDVKPPSPLILPLDVDPGKDGIVRWGNIEIFHSTEPEHPGIHKFDAFGQIDDDLTARPLGVNLNQGPYTAIIQNFDQSAIHTASVPTLQACMNLAKAVLEDQTYIQAEVDKELSKTGSAMSFPASKYAPDKVLCVPAAGEVATFTPENFVKELQK